MTIAKIIKGNGFRGVMDYLLDSDKRPRIIGGCVFTDVPADLAREFRMVANLRRSVTKPVRHFSISFSPKDGDVDDITKEAIAFRILDGLGYGECQFIAIDHHRDDPGHDYAHDHDHMHIVTNAVSVKGEYVRDSFDRYRIQKILRAAERDFGLREIKSSWEVKREKAQGINLDSDLARIVAASLNDRPNLETWLDRLAQSDIDVRFNLSMSDNVMGITYLKEGESHKGSDLGASWAVVNDRVSVTAEDLPLMQATNIKSQEKPVRLSESNRAMFDRAVEMALMKLGRGTKFKNSRADIKLEGDTLSVIRMRPHRLMFKASKTDDGWEPVGFPNIEQRDVEQLERFNGVEPEKFENVAEQVLEQPDIYPVFQRSKPVESRNLSRGMSL
ncbi:relaxase/mobilization nuclease domain-containing protein [Chamaesiphon sp.]|uniref:relaxase/mobilization nuclease domain-containing protein n=1 Tax=Chamaesiphon sp. TaxID=2814140 RepID=UPI0035937DD8